jgi:hypothetical protein
VNDIKLTLSTDPAKRSPSIEEEAHWLEEVEELWYPLGPNRPLKAEPGCWVYFIRGSKLVARARASSFDPPPLQPLESYTGKPQNAGGWHVRIEEMELAKCPLVHRGFQGFRYVTTGEQASFERAFV